MATSGSTDYTVTRDQIIKRCLRILGVVEQGQDPTAAQTSEAARALNDLVKSWQKDETNLWAMDWRTYVPPVSDTILGTDGTNYRCIRSHTSATSNRPVTGNDWSTFWYDDASAANTTWADATAFNSAGDMDVSDDVLGIHVCYQRDNGVDNECTLIGRDSYMEISTKYLESELIDKVMFDVKLTPKVYFYPQPDEPENVFHYLAILKLEDFDNSTDNPYFPAHFYNALTWNLAAQLSSEYSLAIQERNYIDSKAEFYKREAKADDTEYTNIRLIIGAY